MNHLNDTELIDYVIKHDTDPIRIRLAKIMENMPGFILRRLEDVGMDPDTCMFENCYDPGDYITHLETEVEWRDNDIRELQNKLQELEAMTLLEFMENVKSKLSAEKRYNEKLQKDINQARQDREDMRNKLSMWAKLNGDLKTQF
jgi:hypothetical protein